MSLLDMCVLYLIPRNFALGAMSAAVFVHPILLATKVLIFGFHAYSRNTFYDPIFHDALASLRLFCVSSCTHSLKTRSEHKGDEARDHIRDGRSLSADRKVKWTLTHAQLKTCTTLDSNVILVP